MSSIIEVKNGNRIKKYSPISKANRLEFKLKTEISKRFVRQENYVKLQNEYKPDKMISELEKLKQKYNPLINRVSNNNNNNNNEIDNVIIDSQNQ